MTEDITYFLECETKDKELGMSTFSARLDHLIHDYADWLQRNELSAADVDCPKIYRINDLACIATLGLEDGQVILQPRRVYSGPFAKAVNKVRFEMRYLKRWLQTRSYENKDGKKVYVTEVVADRVEFLDSKRKEAQPETTAEAEVKQAESDIYKDFIPDDIPF